MAFYELGQSSFVESDPEFDGFGDYEDDEDVFATGNSHQLTRF